MERKKKKRNFTLEKADKHHFHNICCCSVAKLCTTLWDAKNCSTSSFLIRHHLLGFAQTRVHWVGDTIQPSHPLSPSFLAFNLSQHQGLFQWVCFSHQVAKALDGTSASGSVLPMNIQGWFPLGLTGLISLQTKELSRVFSSITVQKHWFFGTRPSLLSSSHICTCTTGKTIALTIWTFVGKVMSVLFNTLTRFVIAFLLRSKHLLIS